MSVRVSRPLLTFQSTFSGPEFNGNWFIQFSFRPVNTISIAQTSLHLEATRVIRMSGHSRIQCNESADRLVRHLTNPARTIRLISPKDSIAYLKKRYKKRITEQCLAGRRLHCWLCKHHQSTILKFRLIHPRNSFWKIFF